MTNESISELINAEFMAALSNTTMEGAADGWRATLSAAGVLHLRLANPPVNAINTAMWRRLSQTIAAIRDDAAVRSVAITSDSERLFSAGIDYKELRKDDGGIFLGPGDRRRLVRDTLRAFYQTPVPVVVGVRGAAYGAGAVLPCLADLVVGGPGTRLIMAEIDRGVVGGSRFVARLVPEPLMRKMMLLGQPVGGEELAKYGCLAEFVDDDAIEAATLDTATQLAEKHPVVMRLMKQAHVEVEYMPVMEGYAVEQTYSVVVPNSVRLELVPGASS